MPKYRNSHITVRRKRKGMDHSDSDPSSPPSLEPCCHPKATLALKHERIRKFALQMATLGSSEASMITSSPERIAPLSNIPQKSEDGTQETYNFSGVHEPPQDEVLRTIFEWMCDLSSNNSESNTRRSRRLTQL